MFVPYAIMKFEQNRMVQTTKNLELCDKKKKKKKKKKGGGGMYFLYNKNNHCAIGLSIPAFYGQSPQYFGESTGYRL